MKGHSKLTKAEHKKLVDTAERVKYNKTHKASTDKGGARKGKVAGSRLAYDALGRKKK